MEAIKNNKKVNRIVFASSIMQEANGVLFIVLLKDHASL
jgi:hypothetical protein